MAAASTATGAPGPLLAAALALAWAGDAVFGEPRNALHPVAWLGRALGPLGRALLRLPPAAAFIGGALAWCTLALLCGAAAWAWQNAALAAPAWAAVLLLALALKPMFAWRMLRDEVQAVEAALAGGGAAGAESLAAARTQLARLVSRDVSALGPAELREAALETLSENLNDSVVAPLFWAVLAGLPGAVVYRLANTADAMWGYRGRWEWAGKWAARADDLLSWLPARLTGLALAAPRLWPALPVQARLTPSPNGGWPMGALALQLGVQLRKPGVYVLNAGAPTPGAAAFAAGLRRCTAVAWGAAALAVLGLAAAPGAGVAGWSLAW
ncbi:hypothetical protein IP80_15525 [beta proteobacterium AAP65]|nr:hypothetical protein IP80_15525 [beta proteobacterium AAP65]